MVIKKQIVVIFRHNIDAWSYFIISKCTFAAFISVESNGGSSWNISSFPWINYL